MSHGEFLTRSTIWLALGAAAGSAALRTAARRRPGLAVHARSLWTLGGGLFLLHVFCAFHYYHHWSHAAAWQETARQTAELFGWRWGGGLYLNYALAGLWLADIAGWWRRPAEAYPGPSRWAEWWRGFFLFMAFNGAFVFAHGALRWLGLGICLVLGVAWWKDSARTAG